MASEAAVKRASVMLAAVGEPTRLRIVEMLFHGSKNVSEIAKNVGIEIVNASHHLGVLRHSGLAVTEKAGRCVIYSLNPDFVNLATRTIDTGWCTLSMPRG